MRPTTILELLRVLGRKHSYMVLALLYERGEVTLLSQLKAKYRISSKQLIADLRLLNQAGLVENPGKGVYFISNRGKKVMLALGALRIQWEWGRS